VVDGSSGVTVIGSGVVGGTIGGSGGPAGRDGAQETGTSRHSNITNINPIISLFFMVASYMLSLFAGFLPHLLEFLAEISFPSR
jgi:hypothetical protein